MSIFDRLYDIAKANLNHAIPKRAAFFRNGEAAKDRSKRTWRQSRERQESWKDSDNDYDFDQEPASQNNQDPVLAQYYANLELPYGSDLDAVKKAWKRLMRNYHPDRHASNPEKRKLAEELTQNLNRAYSELEKHLGGK